VRANERETDTATGTTDTAATDTTTTDGPTQRDRESERETGGVRRAAAGGWRPADRRRRRYKTGHSGRHRTAKSGERRRLVCDYFDLIARGTKEQKPPFSVFFLPVCRGAFFKVYVFFVWFLVGKDRGPVVVSMRK
jgi:hypothetical protein